MSAPLTSTQLPLDAILDLNGKQTYLGNSFVIPTPAVELSNESETPLLVIANPAGSGKSLFLFSKKFGTDNNNTLIKYYLNPVLNVPGSATAALNLRTGATTVSISKCYLGATVTSNGTFIAALIATEYGLTSDLLFVMDPGASLLVTGTQEGSGDTNIFIENAWYEI